MTRSSTLAFLALLLAVSAFAGEPPVQYGSCATATYPVLIVQFKGADTTIVFPPGTATDTLALEWHVDSIDVWVVMGMDDSSSASPPCECDTATAAAHVTWNYNRALYWRNPWPAIESTTWSSTNDTISPTCPDTAFVGRLGFESAAHDDSAGKEWIRAIGYVNLAQNTNQLRPGQQEVKVYLSSTHATATTGVRTKAVTP